MATAAIESALAWLDAEWRKPTRLSTVPQAMAAMGMDDRDPLRWPITTRVARDWRKRLVGARAEQWASAPDRLAEFQRQLRTWRFPAIALTATERRVGSALEKAWDADPARIASRLKLDEGVVEAALDGLHRIGFLDMPGGRYRLSPRHKRLLSGLGLSFHTVTVEE